MKASDDPGDRHDPPAGGPGPPRQFKICVLGDAAVGKTGLVSVFVGRPLEAHSMRSGAQVELGLATTPSGPCQLVVWDILCADGGFVLDTPYLVGMHGYVIVCDRTRRPTLTGAWALRMRVEEQFGSLPLVLAINKSDCEQNSEVTRTDIERLGGADVPIFETSVTTGSHVAETFAGLAALLT